MFHFDMYLCRNRNAFSGAVSYPKITFKNDMSNETDKKKEVLYPELGKRLADLIDIVGLNQRQFALKVEANPQVISHLMGGYAVPSGKTLMLIADRWPGFNASWLLTGQGEPFTSGLYAKERPATTMPVEAPATSVPKTTQVPTAGVDPELFKEVKDSRDKAWEIVDKKDEELAKERAEKEYYRELWMQQVFGDQHGSAPVTALPGKAEADSYAAVPTAPSEPTGKTYIGMPERDETGNIKTKPKAKFTTDHLAMMDSGELCALVGLNVPQQERAIGLDEAGVEAA
jgi:transcriptional regulator with XRE-family HTH domain